MSAQGKASNVGSKPVHRTLSAASSHHQVQTGAFPVRYRVDRKKGPSAPPGTPDRNGNISQSEEALKGAVSGENGHHERTVNERDDILQVESVFENLTYQEPSMIQVPLWEEEAINIDQEFTFPSPVQVEKVLDTEWACTYDEGFTVERIESVTSTEYVKEPVISKTKVTVQRPVRRIVTQDIDVTERYSEQVTIKDVVQKEVQQEIEVPEIFQAELEIKVPETTMYNIQTEIPETQTVTKTFSVPSKRTVTKTIQVPETHHVTQTMPWGFGGRRGGLQQATVPVTRMVPKEVTVEESYTYHEDRNVAETVMVPRQHEVPETKLVNQTVTLPNTRVVRKVVTVTKAEFTTKTVTVPQTRIIKRQVQVPVIVLEDEEIEVPLVQYEDKAVEVLSFDVVKHVEESPVTKMEPEQKKYVVTEFKTLTESRPIIEVVQKDCDVPGWQMDTKSVQIEKKVAKMKKTETVEREVQTRIAETGEFIQSEPTVIKSEAQPLEKPKPNPAPVLRQGGPPPRSYRPLAPTRSVGYLGH